VKFRTLHERVDSDGTVIWTTCEVVSMSTLSCCSEGERRENEQREGERRRENVQSKRSACQSGLSSSGNERR